MIARKFVPYYNFIPNPFKYMRVAGTVGPIFTSDGTHTFTYSISGADPECASGPSSADNSCGVHIHAGTSCEEDALGHYYMYPVTKDPWVFLNAVYTADSTGAASGTVLVVTGGAAPIGRTFIVHDKSGARIACAILKLTSGEPPGYIRLGHGLITHTAPPAPTATHLAPVAVVVGAVALILILGSIVTTRAPLLL